MLHDSVWPLLVFWAFFLFLFFLYMVGVDEGKDSLFAEICNSHGGQVEGSVCIVNGNVYEIRGNNG